MIYDTLQNLNQYTGLFANLDTAIEYIENNDLTELPMGRTDIDGDNVYVMVMNAETSPTENLNFETHTKYMDLQTDLEGVELCEIALGELKAHTEYNEEKDIAFYTADLSAALVLNTERFAVFMVEEPHKPCVKAQGCDVVKKAVFKIAY